jgi:hypothetical protein
VEYVHPLDLLAEVAKLAPVEGSPFAKLKINQTGKDEKNYGTGHDALFVHEGEKPRAATLAGRSGNGSSKVNEWEWRVKRGNSC